MFEFKNGCYNIEVYMSRIDDIDIMAIKNSNAKSLKGCYKIQVIFLSHDFYQVY
jgi:hypothetical protein